MVGCRAGSCASAAAGLGVLTAGWPGPAELTRPPVSLHPRERTSARAQVLGTRPASQDPCRHAKNRAGARAGDPGALGL